MKSLKQRCSKEKRYIYHSIVWSPYIRKQNENFHIQYYSLSVLQNECREALEQISYDINSQSNELAAHQLLSVYKMAEVLIVPPEFNGSSSIAFVSLTLLLLVTISASTPFTIHLVLC